MWSNAQPVVIQRAVGPKAEQSGRQGKRGAVFGQAREDAS